jgi:uncharacterized phage protein (TIGR01671 family)
MTEKKFRVWDKENKRMIYPGCKGSHWDSGVCTFSTDSLGRLIGVEECVWESEENGNQPDVEIKTIYIDYQYLMQYIGLKDKNGKEIWERDIYKFYDYKIETYEIKKVEDLTEFLIDYGYWDGEFGVNSEERFEVIGNIYENPKLLV